SEHAVDSILGRIFYGEPASTSPENAPAVASSEWRMAGSQILSRFGVRHSVPADPVQAVLILEQVLNGLLTGAYYLLIALGLSLIFALGGIVNLAHGGFYAIGAYLAVILADRIGFGGPVVAAPLLVRLIGVVTVLL